MRLEVELVPSTAWGSNLRLMLTAKQWKVCQRYVYERSGRVCEICGGTGDRWPVECHETWAYDDEHFLQRLTGLIALCPTCHRCKHAGFAGTQGRLHEVIEQIAIVNYLSLETVEDYLNHVFAVWSIRSEYQWDLDTTWLRQLDLPGDLVLAGNRKGPR